MTQTKTVFAVSKMDCASEERMVRMALGAKLAESAQVDAGEIGTVSNDAVEAGRSAF